MSGRQRGVALITAVLVVALASIAAAAMLSSANLAIHRASTLSDTERAWWYADGIEAWVKSILRLDQQNSTIDYLGEAWARQVDYIPVDEGSLRGGITDLQGRFNLNNLGAGGTNLQDPAYLKYKQQFERLLQNLEALRGVSTDGLAESIHDWIDADIEPAGFGGAEDSEYSSLPMPYRTPNRAMTSISELLAVRGVNKAIYLALRDYVCALPEMNTKINVNTAPAAVLQSLSAQASPALAQFIDTRKDKPAENPAAFWSAAYGGGKPLDAPDVDVQSQYFLLHGEAFIGSSHLALYSVIYRPNQNGLPAVISRSQDLE